jgi:hypothetical protein
VKTTDPIDAYSCINYFSKLFIYTNEKSMAILIATNEKISEAEGAFF